MDHCWKQRTCMHGRDNRVREKQSCQARTGFSELECPAARCGIRETKPSPPKKSHPDSGSNIVSFSGECPTCLCVREQETEAMGWTAAANGDDNVADIHSLNEQTFGFQ
jgi:hypothetical protein